MEKQYKAAGLKVIWIGFQDRQEKIKEFMEKHDIRSSVGYDVRDKISRKYGLRYGAGLVMINKEGVVKKRVPKGFSEKALLEALGFIVDLPPKKTASAGA